MNFYSGYSIAKYGKCMDTKISYAGILRRVSACVVDGVLWMIIAFVSLLFDLDNVDKNMTILMATLLITYIIFNILTITKYGCTPGRLLCSVRIKDANTFKNVTLMQATIRYIFREGIWVIYSFLSYLLPGYVSGCLFIILTLVLMFAIFDQRKQTFYDKIAKTVVVDYKPS